MTRTLRFPVALAVLTLLAVSSFAQDRPLVGTVLDVDEGAGRLQIEADDNRSARVPIEIDSVSTTWHGFGTVIADKPEIFTGSSGLANVRLGDRIEVRGTTRGDDVIRALSVTLLGRQVAAPQVGVGETRLPTSVATPTVEQAVAAAAGRIEGTIRQINDREGRLVIQTTDRRMVTVTTYRTTPVWFRGTQYRVSNLEVGDRVRVETDARDARAPEVVARRIDVTQSVRDGEEAPSGARVTMLSGKVARTEPGLDYAYVNDGRGEVRVDMSQAEDAQGENIRARDLRAGDDVEISGSYNRVGDMFLASTVRFAGGDRRERDTPRSIRYSVVTLSGTVVETLADAAAISIRDRDLDAVVRVWAVDDLLVQMRGNANTTADLLRVNDSVLVQAFRDEDGNLIAQTIRLRNR